jgi:hypothetical protein
VWGSGAADVWAVGSNGTVTHWNGSTWNAVSSGTSASFNGVWGSGAADIWAVGNGGTMFRHDFAPPVASGGACKAPISLYCGTNAAPFVLSAGSVSFTTANQFSTYSCGARTESSGEVYYKLDVPVTGTVSVTLTPNGGDLDLVALGADSVGYCDTAQCKAASQTAGTNVTDSITLSTTQGQTLYFVVDGPTADNIGYTLATSCAKK